MNEELEERFPINSDGSLAAYAWPGGYPIIYLDIHDEPMCALCATEALRAESELDRPQTWDVYWEGPTIHCAECNTMLESAYGDPEEEK